MIDDRVRAMQWSPEKLEAVAERDARLALAEDLGIDADRWPSKPLALDLSGALLPSDEQVSAEVISREAGIFCGSAWALTVCRLVSDGIECVLPYRDGERIGAGDTIAKLEGSPAELVGVERALLNFLQLMSGTATKARAYADAVAHTNAQVFDTRKTVPGLRAAQKYAVFCGGCHNHRMGLFDAYLLKENHLMAMGGVEGALEALGRDSRGFPVQVEVESMGELESALQAGAKLIMLDNFSLETTREAVRHVAGRAALEASGDVTFQTIAELAETGVDRISVGDLTKRVDPLDLSMRFVG